MSDYLSHIVEQSMGIAESVQPLIAPMFAPPSFSAFLSLDDMMQQPPDSVTEEQITASPPLRLRIEEILSQPKAEKQRGQSAMQPLQRESVRPTPIAPISSSQRETMKDSGNAFPPQASKVEQPHAEGSLHKPVPMPERLSAGQAEHDQLAVSPVQPPAQEAIYEHDGPRGTSPVDDAGLENLLPRAGSPALPVDSPFAHERPESLPAPVDASSVNERLENLTPPVQPIFLSPQNDVVRTSTEQSPASAGLTTDGTPMQVQHSLAVTQQAPNQSMPGIPTVQPRPVLAVKNDVGVQEMNVTAKTSEATVSGDTTAPSKQPSHDFDPFDTLVQQQSALYPASLLPGALSLLPDQTGKENRRGTGEAAGSERVSFAAQDERNEVLHQRPSPTQEVSGDLAPESGAEQNLPMVSTRRDDGANELTPMIHVSIGRVEVRATVAPAAPAMKRATPAAPAISLSDYLQRRKGGVG